MTDWVPLAETTDYTLNGNVVTLVGITPDAESAFDLHYSYAEASAIGGHTHTVEQKDGTWTGGAWTLGHRPDNHEFLLLRRLQSAMVWQITSDLHVTTNQQLRLYEISGDPAALSWAVADGPWTVPAGELVTFLQATTSSHCFIGTIRNGGPTRLYRFDRSDGSFNVIFSFTHTVGIRAPRVWQVILVSESEMYMVLARGETATDNGIYHTTDGGSNWTKFTDPPFYNGALQAFAETPAQVYSMVLVGTRIYVLHSGLNNGAGTYWAVSYTDNSGGTWANVSGTIGAFSKGGRGFLFTVNNHLPYIYESFITYGSGDVLGATQIETGIGDDTDAWMVGFSDGTVLARGSLATRISTDNCASWSNAASSAPEGSQWTDVLHVANVLLSQDWLIVPDWDSQHLSITTDKGTTWQTLPLPNYCGFAAFVGGAG